MLQGGLAKLDLVTREEFEVQRAVLLRTRQKLDEMQRTVAEVEAQLGNAAADGNRHRTHHVQPYVHAALTLP